MTLRANARLAGLTLLIYMIAAMAAGSQLDLLAVAIASRTATGAEAAAAQALGASLGFLHGPMTFVPWIPMALFELILGFWLLSKGVAVRSAPAPYPTPSGSLV